MKIKTFFWYAFILFIIVVVLYAIYMTYSDISGYVKQQNKTEKYSDNVKVKIVLFYAPWCGFCVSLKKSGVVMKTFKDMNNPQVVYEEYDADKDVDKLVNKYNINGFPTILAISPDGTKLGEFKGDRNDPESLIKFTNDILNKN